MKMDWLVTFRSVTYAQRAERLLQRMGIDCALQRTPRELSQRGCGYCLAVRGQDAMAVVGLLREHDVPFGKVYVRKSPGITEERML